MPYNHPTSILLLTLFTILINHGYGEMIYEDGYTVKTVVDGNKLNINPHSAVSRPLLHDLLLLDSSASVFYTVSFPLSQDSVMKRFAGNEKGYSDGDAGSAMFNKPKSFAVDSKGNAYVADRGNFAVRKISRLGITTTIAGGYSKTPGRADGPGRNVTFSADYELTFAPEICSLIIMDHGNKLIRLINLKQDDCASHKSGLGRSVVWASAIIIPCLVGLVIGFVTRPYILPHDGLNFHNLNKSWKNYRTKVGRQTRTPYFDTRNATVNSTLTFLKQLILLLVSQATLMIDFCINRSNRSSSTISKPKECFSLLDSDNAGSNSGFVISQKYVNQLKDLISADSEPGSCSSELVSDDLVEKEEIRSYCDDMMQASIMNFSDDVHLSTAFESPFLGVSSVVKRK